MGMKYHTHAQLNIQKGTEIIFTRVVLMLQFEASPSSSRNIVCGCLNRIRSCSFTSLWIFRRTDWCHNWNESYPLQIHT